jgi:formate hydrogenlyase transcriptional activator
VKLLRVLQEHEFEPVGSSRTVRVDVRVIAATNRDLEDAVRAGRFRSDLFYRLNVFPLTVPPLRDRASDIPQLVTFFLTRFAQRFGRSVHTASEETMARLVGYPWPGNIRELQNVIERAVVLSPGPVLELDRDLLPAATPEPASSPSGGAGPPSLGSLEEVERNHIKAVLERTGGVIEGPRGAAGILKMHPNTLRSRLEKLGIRRSPHETS